MLAVSSKEIVVGFTSSTLNLIIAIVPVDSPTPLALYLSKYR